MVAALYMITLGPTTAFWDTSEYVATAHILGIPHPPGNPLFVVLARTWNVLLSPLGLPVAVQINLFSVLMSVLAHGLWFLVVFRILSFIHEDRRFSLAGAFVATLVSATSFTVWNQSTVNEKVYTVSLMTIALLTWLAFHWRDNLGQGKDDNLLVLMVFILALSVGNHLMAFLAAPALVVFVLWVHPRTLLNYRLYVAAAAATFLGLSIHMFLPLRAALDPIINEADPTCGSVGSALVSIVSWGQAGCAELAAALSRQQYDKPPLIPRLAPLSSQVSNYLQYFDWQWARSLSGDDTVFPIARTPFTLLFGGLGVFGAFEHYRKDRTSWWYMLILLITLSAGLVFYLNFKYGYSMAAPVLDRDLHEVRERDYFFIVGFSVWGLWAGVGIAALWKRLAARAGSSFRLAAPVLGIGALPLLLNWPYASRAGDYAARDWGYNLLMSVEPYAILFTNGDNDTFPLWYIQEVEGIRRDVTVIVTSYLNTDWYVKQLRDLTRPCSPTVDPTEDPTRILCQRPYRPSAGEPRYTHDPAEAEAGRQVPLLTTDPVSPPTRTAFDLDDDTIERVAGSYSVLREARSFRLGNMAATLPAGQILLPWHQFALSAINASLGDRPVYFASTTNAFEALGLTPYLIREGLAFRVFNGDIGEEAPEGVVRMEYSPLSSVVGDWLNVPRTETLIWDVFVHRGGIPDDWSFWPDRSTLGIPNYYAWAHFALAQAAQQRGDEEQLARNRERAEAWALLGS
jgi:hypothetical protein